MSRWRLRRRVDGRSESGAAAVETALVLTFIVLPLTFAIISYGYMFSFRQGLSQAAAEGARASVGASTPEEARTAARSAVTNALVTHGVTCASDGTLRRASEGVVGACTVSPPDGACGASGVSKCLTVTLRYDYRDHSLLPTTPGFGFTLPARLTFTSVVETS